MGSIENKEKVVKNNNKKESKGKQVYNALKQVSPAKAVTFLKQLGTLLVIIFIIYFVFSLRKCGTGEALIDVYTNDQKGQITLSPEQIASIEDIGEWVFLEVEAEEMVDTVRKNMILSDDALSRIYVGTLHFGINMKTLTGKNWITCHGDTATLRLPKVKLLDTKFINEAKSRTFYQEGSWDNKAMANLYSNARNKMIRRHNTPENQRLAQESAEVEITKFIKAFGFKTVELLFAK